MYISHTDFFPILSNAGMTYENDFFHDFEVKHKFQFF